jgi:glycosyltransferase involved in cell wall biosynthesis
MANDKEFLGEILRLPNVKFNGTLEPSDALNLEASSDVMIGLYDPDRIWHHLTLPNKHFETMMCGVPLITNVAPELVQTVDFGIIVEYDNVKQLKEAIVRLKNDPELRIRLGANGRKAFLEKYNWGKMEEKLYEIYDNLMNR